MESGQSGPQERSVMKMDAEVFECPDDFFTTCNFTPIRVLGKGMMGEVVLAVSKEEGNVQTQKAVKTFTKKTSDGGKGNRRLLSFEVAILQNIHHENIIGNIKAFECPNEYVLCMPYYKEGNLKQHLSCLTRDHTEKYFRQLTSAIHYLHNRRLAHRDIKPDNILISDDGNVILSDFGLACVVPPNAMLPVKHCGTKEYMAPELEGFNRRSVNVYKCDMFAVGVVLWNMTFRKVRAPIGMSYLSYLRAQRHAPASYKNIMENLLHKDFNMRWDSNKLMSTVSIRPSTTCSRTS